jgi:hypothetical protein
MLAGIDLLQRAKIHVFTCYFYTKLLEGRSPPDQHALVSRWTKNVDLFDMDYIIGTHSPTHTLLLTHSLTYSLLLNHSRSGMSVYDLCDVLDKTVYAMNEVLRVTAELKMKELAIVECQRTYSELSSFRNPSKADSSYIIKSKIAGIIFDLDGTLTLPGYSPYLLTLLTHFISFFS